MKLVVYIVDGHSLEIRPAPVERAWMEMTDQRYAYRCLPLNIANAHGWEILCRSGFAARWNGRKGLSAISITPDAGTTAPAISHFGHGVLTFHVPCLFRTEPGFDLMVQGPVNQPKDGIAPLSAVIETDWAPYGFTMNWLFTRPEATIRFERGEPYCHIFPLRRGDLEKMEPEMLDLSTNPELKTQHDAWTIRRNKFNADLKRPGSEAQSEKWQKLYHRGLDAGGNSVTADHLTRLKLKPFAPGARRGQT
jgi:hypothetical protein